VLQHVCMMMTAHVTAHCLVHARRQSNPSSLSRASSLCLALSFCRFLSPSFSLSLSLSLFFLLSLTLSLCPLLSLSLSPSLSMFLFLCTSTIWETREEEDCGTLCVSMPPPTAPRIARAPSCCCLISSAVDSSLSKSISESCKGGRGSKAQNWQDTGAG